jgi:hypothetical protein
MSQLPSQVLVWMVGVIFGAGAWSMKNEMSIRQMRKDLNGIGANVRRTNWNLLVALMVITEKREDRQRLADLLRQQ